MTRSLKVAGIAKADVANAVAALWESRRLSTNAARSSKLRKGKGKLKAIGLHCLSPWVAIVETRNSCDTFHESKESCLE